MVLKQREGGEVEGGWFGEGKRGRRENLLFKNESRRCSTEHFPPITNHVLCPPPVLLALSPFATLRSGSDSHTHKLPHVDTMHPDMSLKLCSCPQSHGIAWHRASVGGLGGGESESGRGGALSRFVSLFLC